MISSATRIIQYNGNGVTTSFAVPFAFYDNEHIKAQTLDTATGDVTVLAIITDYNLVGVDNPSGGTLTTVVPVPSGSRLTIYREVPFTQETDYVNNDRFDSEAHEAQMDLIVMMAQQLAQGQLAIKFPLSEPSNSETTLPAGPNRIDSVIWFNDVDGTMQTLTTAEFAELVAGKLTDWDTTVWAVRNGDNIEVNPFRTKLLIDQINNTSDANKPVSTAQQTALDLKAPLASPALTGTPTAPTATAGANTTQIATTAFVTAADNLKQNTVPAAVPGNMASFNGSGQVVDSGRSVDEFGAWAITSVTPYSLTGTLTSASGTLKYKLVGKTVFFALKIVITTNGTGSGGIGVSLPWSFKDDNSFSGRENAISYKALASRVFAGNPYIDTFNYDNTYPGGNGAVLNISGVAEIV